MKKILSLLLGLSLFIGTAQIAQATISAGWSANSSSSGFIFPNRINGTEQTVVASSTISKVYYVKDINGSTIYYLDDTGLRGTANDENLINRGSGVTNVGLDNAVVIDDSGSVTVNGTVSANNLSTGAASGFGTVCLEADNGGNINPAGTSAPCGKGTVNTGAYGQLGWYAADGTTISATGTQITIGNIRATTTNATSTFAGSLAVGPTVFASPGNHALAFGNVVDISGLNNPRILASSAGSLAGGDALDHSITATAAGSIALGYANNGDVTATAAGAVAIGDNVNATAANSFAIGKGFTNNTVNTLMFGMGPTPSWVLSITNNGVATTAPSARLAVKSGGTGTGRAFVIANSNDAEKVTVLDNGNFGIGTTSPGTTLSVSGNAVIDNRVTATAFTATSSSANSLFLGNISIGTTSATAPLTISGNDSGSPFFANLLIQPTGANKSTSIGLQSTYLGTTTNFFFGLGSGEPNNDFRMAKVVNGIGVDMLDIDTRNGNVGIGLTNPSGKLSVTGNGSTTVMLGDHSSGATADPVAIDFGGTYGSGSPGSTANLKFIMYNDTTNKYGIGMSAALMEFQAASSAGHGFFVNGGTGVMYINPSGQVAMGNDFSGNLPTPLGGLSVNGPVADPSLTATAGVTANFRSFSGSAPFTNLAITNSGNSPYGTSLQVRHASVDGSSYPLNLNPLGGGVGVATTAPWRVFSVQGTVALNGLTAFSTGDSAVCQRVGTGEITVDSGVSSCIVSSRTVKHDILPYDTTEAANRIGKLNPVSFEYNGTNKPDLGLIAEDVASIDPRYAQYNDKGEARAINWSAITADLIKVVQNVKGSKPIRSAEENWQWIFIAGLILTVGYQQKQINSLKK